MSRPTATPAALLAGLWCLAGLGCVPGPAAKQPAGPGAEDSVSSAADQGEAPAEHPPLERPVLRRPAPPDGFTRSLVRSRLAELKLECEGLTGDGRVALVSGRVVRPGDRIDIFVVDHIGPDGVALRGPEQSLVYLRQGALPAPFQH